MIIQLRDLNTRKVTGLFGEFSSLIWTERFQDEGDFELITPLSKRAVELIKEKRFIKIPDSDNLMIITSVEYEEDELKAKGYDLKLLLYNRILYEWRNTETQVNLINFMKGLFESALVNSEYEERNIPNISIAFDVNEEISNTTIVTDINRGDTLGDALYTLCKEFNLGIDASFDVYTGKIQFLIYSANDKRNLVFSNGNHNFKRSRYTKSYDNFVSSMLVAGEGEGTDRKMVTVSRVIKVSDSSGTTNETIYKGIDRVEGFLDARDVQKISGETASNYKDRLKSRAIDEMNDRDVVRMVDGEIRNTNSVVLEADSKYIEKNRNSNIPLNTYGKGDIVTVRDDYFNATVRIIEVIRSWSSRGYEIYPTFEVVDVTTSEVTEEFNMT